MKAIRKNPILSSKVEGMAYIPPLTVIGDGVFLGPGVIFTNDPYPMSDRMVGVIVKDDAIVCAGAMLKAGITVGERAVIGMGAVVTKDVPEHGVVVGIPGNVISDSGSDGYINRTDYE